MKTNLVLIGFMGTGKTSLGRKLAKTLNKDFIDTDLEIEKLTGLSIPLIFKKHGEIRFRSEEKLMIKKVAMKDECVISTGGGVVLAPENMKALRKKGWIISLTASPEIVYSRIAKRNNRPLLYKHKSIEYIEFLMKQREPYYKQADLLLDTSKADSNTLVERVIEFLKEKELDETDQNTIKGT
ncbi:MAG: shikimate kinase [Zhaonellaceae bacterium]|jgi:shikimate kinase